VDLVNRYVIPPKAVSRNVFSIEATNASTSIQRIDIHRAVIHICTARLTESTLSSGGVRTREKGRIWRMRPSEDWE
jgi:hypothetical protein